jgi:arginyl-tRNA synthetase
VQQQISLLIKKSLENLNIEFSRDIIITHTKDKKFGDFASNIAMMLAKTEKTNPRDLAEKIIQNLPNSEIITKTEIAGAGFINFFVSQNASFEVINQILKQQQNFGKSEIGKNSNGNPQKVLLEFVSANPTGPLHVGHGRGAAYGATLANLMRTTGFEVENEYYVNDAGRQMDILATSVYLRYVDTDKFPSNGYKGDYILDIAKQIKDIARLDIFENVCKDEKNADDGGDKEKHIDDLIKNCKDLLKDDYYQIYNLAIDEILSDIKQDLSDFGVDYQHFFSEKSLENGDLNSKTIAELEKSGDIYTESGAKWFKTTKYGDEKDRVVVRDNGLHTYFASDIAYHLEKYNRGYDKIINIWGADHHGYIARVKASISALGLNPDKLEILLVQFANLYKNGAKLPMSTRSGSFVTLKDLRNEVGNDATRFFYILRKSDQHLDFDMDLAVKKSNENPVFYIQYAHARICSVLKEQTLTNPDLTLLTNKYEQDLVKQLSKYCGVIESASKQYEPHQLAYYLKDLASSFHSYYHNCEFLISDENLKNARLNLITAVKQVIFNGLEILGVSSPEKM